ncbi:2-amino-4-hydroxy-6-hydroxymethyldihydropteridine diphosphokinase [Colwellia sp. MB3u-70]|uniref:2-amino-4-hydroxy-6- hydroxymethyldihydropteridine diphosphokinase n=1 Tax=unclassified Colwellia TaxID=196834 RepID=UPI0015F470B1|nr:MULTISPECIES: 2-amino-4-hydroxy-6-hydroxymethyldihydropteridine diphosphokinase [unclassified Colwellia]MBA6291856.1 2-amino-4-hydroxy-6-hydroxymethyldihydropteridine diphosphokinase [Colwellia sp. MB3u-8]MBA6308500.1 2-amino-4-hydroxy-6-hydroxymethyldihydropteridine diphosphokinase [Colwellia sp. MB3u-70]
MAKIYISLGSNINRQHYIEQGLYALTEVFGSLTLSSLFESEAVGFAGKAFYNMVAGVNTELTLAEVAATLRKIEFAHGRSQAAKKFSPRTLDLDLLLYDDIIADSPAQIPRDEISKNAFVLCPLAEVAGPLTHPIIGQCYDELWQQYDKSQQKLKTVAFMWPKK